jgi:hypothetical protein
MSNRRFVYRKLEAVDRVAIRYLGGILEFPTFWMPENYERHQYTAMTLLQKLSRCAREIGIDSGFEKTPEEALFSDREGIDLLTNATLVGIQIWTKDINKEEIKAQCWFSDLQALLQLLFR